MKYRSAKLTATPDFYFRSFSDWQKYIHNQVLKLKNKQYGKVSMASDRK